MKCTNCGNEDLQNINQFCDQCGHQLHKDEVTEDINEEITEETKENIEELTEKTQEIIEDKADTIETKTEDFSKKSFQELEEYMEEEKNKAHSPILSNELEEVIDDKKENELLEEIQDLEKTEEKIEELTEEFQEKKEENKGKGGLKFKFQLVTFIIGLVAILLAAYYVTELVNKDSAVLLIDSESNVYISEVGSKKTTLFKENAGEFTIDFMTGDSKGNYYYPVDLRANEIGVAEFDAYKSNGKDEDVNFISDVEGIVYPTPKGEYVLNFKSVEVLYNNLLGDLYVHDHTSNTLVEKDVFAESLKISEDGKYALFLKDESTDLYIYDFNKKSTTKVDEGINGIINVDDKFENIIYTKSNADIGTKAVSTAYSTSYKGNPKKIATNIIDGEAAVFGDKLIYGKPNDTIPDFREYLSNPAELDEKDVDKSQMLWDNFFSYNFFQLWEVNLNGSGERMIGEYIHAIEYISEDGTTKVLIRLKNSDEIEKLTGITDAELSKLPNLIKEIYLGDGTIQSFSENTRDVVESTGVTGSPYVVDEKTNTLYYIYNGNLYSTSIGVEESVATLIDTDVKVMFFNNDRLNYKKQISPATEEEEEKSELYQLVQGEKVLIDTDVLTDLIAEVDEVIVYYKLIDEEVALFRVGDGSVKELGKVASGVMEIYNDIVYFVDEKNNLYMSKGNKIDLLEKNVTSIIILEK